MKKIIFILLPILLLVTSCAPVKKVAGVESDKNFGYVVSSSPKKSHWKVNEDILPREGHWFQEKPYSLTEKMAPGFYYINDVCIRVFAGYITYVELTPSQYYGWKCIENPWGGTYREPVYVPGGAKIIKIVPISPLKNDTPPGYCEIDWGYRDGKPISFWNIKSR
jgi:hypothetical protein